jgi:holo-[acyl-carrier protein] synthase
MNVLAIGTEIVECLRIARMIERHGDLFINRVYTPVEIRYCHSRMHSTQHFAGRWAAKEAVLKTLGTKWQRGLTFQDIEIHNDEAGKLSVGLRGGARDVVVARGIREIMLSVSHARSHAIAYAMALGAERNDGSER